MRTEAIHILQITPTSYSKDGVIGGGEQLALYIDEALRQAAADLGLTITTSVLALDGAAPAGGNKDRSQAVAGRPWDVQSLDAASLAARIRPADAVYIHQCMTEVGLFAAAHARLLGKRVVGSDAGAGEANLLAANPDAMSVYDSVHAISVFAASAFRGMPVAVHVIPGPVDTTLHRPPPPDTPSPDPGLVLSIGRILPHKGFDRAIRALPSDMTMIIVGQHYDRDYLGFLRTCAAGKNVQFLDGLQDAEVRELMYRAGTCVHPSTHVDHNGRFYHKPELLGLAPLEALACGLPTIVSDAACLPELAGLPGCRVFHTEAELTAMLRQAGPRPDPTVMHAAVDATYGLRTVGHGILTMMEVG